MTTKNLKNSGAIVGALMTMLCTNTSPHMVKWYMATYVILLISLWLGDEQDTH